MSDHHDMPAHVGAEFFTRTDFWARFHHGACTVRGVNLHYVAGGEGEPVLLIPGWPQSWYAWRYLMVQLAAAGRRVIALDPRGMGESDAPRGDYDLQTVAAEVHEFAVASGLLTDGPIDLVGHDVGSWIAYACASDWPQDFRSLTVMDALIPGLSTPRNDLDAAEANLRSWHFAFNRLDDLPEILISGKESAFLTWLFRAKTLRGWTIAPEDIAVYARQLAAPGALAAASAYYQAAFSPAGVAANQRRAETRLQLPVLALGAERGVGDGIVKAMAGLAHRVSGGVIAGAGHYLPEEAHGRITDELTAFWATL
ncbi:alpha/beta fold hydrolase [Serratia rubidaea]|uniref:alpha/beta fold hydrolase n=1 Tax=Serratia rubidaea TaxID=61652 RepID=UPI00242D5D42|nr:alpha/beta hydrolase [Serratia rubidaea]MCR0998176.1 alpha/beta hydrolase [Serratia rubidaea]